MKLRHSLLSIFALLSIVGWGPFSFFSHSNNETPGSSAWINREVSVIDSQASNLDPAVLRVSLEAYLKARSKGLDSKQVLTIVDYSKPSTERRLWVVDLKSGRVLFNTWVSHGKNSGNVNSTSFSNQPGSLKSSMGVFLTTSETYSGGEGYSLRIQGLERGINDNAYRRDIIFHGAWYAEGDIAKQHGALGRSWGCFAVGENTVKPLINTIKDRTLVVAYYPDRYWLKNSTFLAG